MVSLGEFRQRETVIITNVHLINELSIQGLIVIILPDTCEMPAPQSGPWQGPEQRVPRPGAGLACSASAQAQPQAAAWPWAWTGAGHSMVLTFRVHYIRIKSLLFWDGTPFRDFFAA